MTNPFDLPRSDEQAHGKDDEREYTCSTLSSSPSWTDLLPKSSHNDFFKDADWASTPLGPIEKWDHMLRFAVNMLFNDSRGAAVYWGPELTGMYNENFIPIISSAHPILMGKPFWVGFPSAWGEMKNVFDTVFQKGECVEFQRMELLVQKGNGFPEEAYFVGQFIPLKGETGKVEGTYNSGYESTAQVLYERRREQLDKLAAIHSTSMSKMFLEMKGVLKTNPRDVSMVLVYSVDDESQSENPLVRLECSVGVPDGHPSAPIDGVLGESQEGFLPFFEKARATMTQLVFLESSGNLDREIGHLLVGMEFQGWEERCRDLSIVPLQSGSRPIGFMAIATNPRRGFDHSSAQFVADLAQQIAIKWTSAITVKSAHRREQRLLQDLAETEQRIRHMALNAPVGMVQLTTEGKIDWANDQWYDITSNSKENISSIAWVDCYMEASQDEANRQWDRLIRGSNTSCELQLRRKFIPPIPDDVEHYIWVTALGFPVIANNQVKYIMATLTDVSHLKWAESVQARNADRAAKAKRQQEEFIDVTSHEMRNPLSAMYQCASMISTSLNGIVHEADRLLEVVQSNVDAANVIMMCAAHQKRIIDDVLILNRLDTMMLSITPVAIKIPEMLEAVVKMFQVELDVAGVSSQLIQQASFSRYVPGSVYCDSSRLTQIFINLITNAIKFIRNCDHRTIRIRYGATMTTPTEGDVTMTDERFHWSPDAAYQMDPTDDKEWGNGQPLYLCFSLQDTGPGLEAHEIPRLFSRFAQANARTHITYGGSGLGLYISNALAQRQGGRMGIASAKGTGTTIAFYIKSKLVPPSLQSPETFIFGNTTASPQAVPGTKISSDTSKHKKRRTVDLGTSQGPIPHSNAKISVLLVEDNLINQRVLRKQLQNSQCEVHVANHGLEALDLLQTTTIWSANKSNSKTSITIHVILMDWEMPKMDGLTCTKHIRAIENERSLAHLPIIGTTANARDEQIQDALESGMDDVITKPFLVDELMLKIRHWIGEKQL